MTALGPGETPVGRVAGLVGFVASHTRTSRFFSAIAGSPEKARTRRVRDVTARRRTLRQVQRTGCRPWPAALPSPRRRVTRWYAAGRQPVRRETAGVTRRCGPSPRPRNGRPPPRTRRRQDGREGRQDGRRGIRDEGVREGSRRAGTSGLVRDGCAGEGPSAAEKAGPRVVRSRPDAGAAVPHRGVPRTPLSCGARLWGRRIRARRHRPGSRASSSAIRRRRRRPVPQSPRAPA